MDVKLTAVGSPVYDDRVFTRSRFGLLETRLYNSFQFTYFSSMLPFFYSMGLSLPQCVFASHAHEFFQNG